MGVGGDMYFVYNRRPALIPCNWSSCWGLPLLQGDQYPSIEEDSKTIQIGMRVCASNTGPQSLIEVCWV